MKKTALALILLAISCIFLFSTFAWAGNVGKAKDFMKAGMFKQAIALLEKEINANPANADAHYELGNCYALTYNVELAEERFKSAVQLNDIKYAHKVGEKFADAGKNALKQGVPIINAQTLFAKAIQYQPLIRAPLTECLRKDGEKLLRANQLGQEISKFLMAAFFSNDEKIRIHQLYLNFGDKATNENCCYFYQQAAIYCDNCYNPKVGDRLIAIGKKLTIVPGQESSTQQYRNIAIQYLGKANVDLKFPMSVEYQPGKDYDFYLQPGEQTDHLVTFAKESQSYHIFYTVKSNFVRVYENGDKVPLDGTYNQISDKGFRFLAITQCHITLKVR